MHRAGALVDPEQPPPPGVGDDRARLRRRCLRSRPRSAGRTACRAPRRPRAGAAAAGDSSSRRRTRNGADRRPAWTSSRPVSETIQPSGRATSAPDSTMPRSTAAPMNGLPSARRTMVRVIAAGSGPAIDSASWAIARCRQRTERHTPAHRGSCAAGGRPRPPRTGTRRSRRGAVAARLPGTARRAAARSACRPIGSRPARAGSAAVALAAAMSRRRSPARRAQLAELLRSGVDVVERLAEQCREHRHRAHQRGGHIRQRMHDLPRVPAGSARSSVTSSSITPCSTVNGRWPAFTTP